MVQKYILYLIMHVLLIGYHYMLCIVREAAVRMAEST